MLVSTDSVRSPLVQPLESAAPRFVLSASFKLVADDGSAKYLSQIIEVVREVN